MSLSYKILWIDDNPTTVRSKIGQIKTFLEEQGFKSVIDVIESGNDIESYLLDPLLDLIVTDYKIHDDLNGKELAERIRESDAMVDIILYSQVAGTDLYKEVGTLDGVYISNRQGLEDKIKEVIEITIRRTQRVSNMRGIVISEAIDIENQIEDIILSYYDTREKELAKELLSGDGCNELGPKIRFLNSTLKNIVASIKNSADATEKKMLQNIELLLSIAKKLENEVCKPRNMLAHVEHTIDNNTIFLKSLKSGYEDIKIDTGCCQKMRQSFMKHASNLDQIKSFLSKWHEYKKKVQKN
ncbi:MAG: response regulator [Desulfobacteraceae bacterium]|nr:response regulator [Desulfobacteraceae bacterium]